jgi:hypothetical protein
MPGMTAQAEAAQEDAALCEGCENMFPRHALDQFSHYCLTCLCDVIAQDEQSRRDLLLRTLAASLRKIPLGDELVGTITGIVADAWAAS